MIISRFLLLISLCFQPLSAGEFSAQIKTASLEIYDDWYQLDANIDYKLSPTATEAIQNNIPLVWRLNVKFKKKQPLWDKTLLNHEYRYKIRYHALLSSYSISNENAAKSQYFNSLAAALNALSQIRNLKIIKSVNIEKNSIYSIAIKLQFDREVLPLPLRAMAYLNANWDLSSHWHIWTLRP